MTRIRGAVLIAVAALTVATATLPLAPGQAAATAQPAPTYLPGTAPLDPTPSLPSVTDGARPGPDVLYADQPAAPQLASHDPRFRAAPLLVSGTEAYDAGEYLYQDYLYDDHGSNAMPVDVADQTAANGTQLPLPQGTVNPNALVYNVGSITYPTDPVYAGNAADLVEFRAAVGAQSTAFRFTLNTLQRADTTIVALALDTDRNAATGTSTLPRDPGAPFPGTDAVLTTWGTGAEVSTFTAAGTLIATTPVPVSTDLASTQITVTVPHAVLTPTGTVRATLATGLYDAATGGWLRPQTGDPTATTPGGAGPQDPTPSGIFNLGFRMDENVVRQNTPPDEEQATDLESHTPTAEARDIDFAALAAGTVRSTVPASGLQIRIFASRQSLGVGEQAASPQYLGQLQPYAVYVPTSGATSHPHPLLVYGHSNGENYWQYDGSNIMKQLGEAHDTVVLSPTGRARSGWYIGYSEYDVFEAWNDVARHASLDPTRTALGGYSMGGYMTYRLGGLYPDLFGKAFSAMGPPGKQIWIPPAAPTDGIATLTNLWLENTRNVPYLDYAETADELVPQIGPLTQNVGSPGLGTTSFNQLGYRYRYLVFSGGEHYTLAILGYNFPIGQAFLADTAVDRDPAHVTYAQVPAAGAPALGLVHDHAYWVSHVTVADTSAGDGAKGVIDARSEGFGVGDPTAVAETDAGVENLDYVETGNTWSAPPVEPVADKVDVTMTNVSAAALQLDRARLSAAHGPLTLSVTADRAATLTLSDAGPDATAAGTMDGAPLAGIHAAGGSVVLPVAAGAHTYVLRAAAAPAVPTTAPGTAAAATGATAGTTAAKGAAPKPARRGTPARAGVTAVTMVSAGAAAAPVRGSRTLAFTGTPGWLELPAFALLGAGGLLLAARRRLAWRQR